jgi:threonine/homoserine/homoserine lactone efflux protein
MQDFLWIAGAHFLALLSPGPDFFLVARSSLAHGWRGATGACIGIALANGVFIAAAFGAWMMLAVLAWDMAVAVALAIGSATLRQRFAQALPLLERLSGVMLIVLAVVLLADQAGNGSR